MKRLLIFLCTCIASVSMAVGQVTIDARDLKLYENMAGFPFYILRMEASSGTAAIRLQTRISKRSLPTTRWTQTSRH